MKNGTEYAISSLNIKIKNSENKLNLINIINN